MRQTWSIVKTNERNDRKKERKKDCEQQQKIRKEKHNELKPLSKWDERTIWNYRVNKFKPSSNTAHTSIHPSIHLQCLVFAYEINWLICTKQNGIIIGAIQVIYCFVGLFIYVIFHFKWNSSVHIVGHNFNIYKK